MEQRRISLQDTSVEQIQQFDNSIAHWSIELVRMDLQRKALLENIDNIYQGRQEILDKLMQEAGVDPTQVVQVKMINVQDGKTEMAVLIKPKSPPGAGGSPGMPGSQTSGNPIIAGPGGVVRESISSTIARGQRSIPDHGAPNPFQSSSEG